MNKLSDRFKNHIISAIRYGIGLYVFSKTKRSRFKIPFSKRWICLKDYNSTVTFDRQYVYHIAWAVRSLLSSKTREHIDFSSSVYFIATISAFIKTIAYDFRKLDLRLNNLTTKVGDVTRIDLDNESVDSVSCMHVIEHIGLGRYGDPINYDGDLMAISELKRIVAIGGNLYIAVPMGDKSVIQYNAHRIYTYNQFLSYFPEFEIVDFMFIKDDAFIDPIVTNAKSTDLENSFYGCGCFWLRKNASCQN